MHIPTTALFAISFYMLGRSSTVHAEVTPHDDFGMADYKIKCGDEVYSKQIIYDTARHACVTIKAHPELRNRAFLVARYRNRFPSSTKGDDRKLLEHVRDIVPIKEQVVFRFDLDRQTREKMSERGQISQLAAGDDRLALGKNCHIIGIFTDRNYPGYSLEPTIEWCSIDEEPSDAGIPRSISPRPPIRSPESSSDRSSRSRERSRERFQQGSRDLSQEINS